jgi:hypothetical protein
MPLEDREDPVDPTRLVAVRPGMTFDEPRRELFERRHLPVSSRVRLPSLQLLVPDPFPVLTPALRCRFRRQRRPAPESMLGPIG